MKSDVFMVNSDAGRMAAARYATEEFAADLGLERHDTLRLSLLVEETLGLVKGLVDDFYGRLWFESEGRRCEIHLEATADMNADRKEELLSVSITGKNASARGFMARLGETISGLLRSAGKSMDAYGQETMKYGIVHTPDMASASTGMVTVWSLQSYVSDLNAAPDGDTGAEAAWDELEKSIVAKLADDVIVGVRGDRIDLVIKKTF